MKGYWPVVRFRIQDVLPDEVAKNSVVYFILFGDYDVKYFLHCAMQTSQNIELFLSNPGRAPFSFHAHLISTGT